MRGAAAVLGDGSDDLLWLWLLLLILDGFNVRLANRAEKGGNARLYAYPVNCGGARFNH